MERIYCPYCGAHLSDGCDCQEFAREDERLAVDEHARYIAEIEERQHDSGFYSFQDTMDMYREM